MAAFWPLFYGLKFIKANKVLLTTWFVACFAMSAFTLLPVLKVESVELMLDKSTLERDHALIATT